MEKAIRIIFYDFADLNYSSYFINGFFQNEKKFDYEFVVTKRTPPPVLKAIDNEWKEVLFSVSLFKVETGGDFFYFCIDARDSCRADEASRGYCLPLLDNVKYYYKVNYNQDIVNADPKLKSYNKIIKGTPLFFPVKVRHPLKFLPKIMPSGGIYWNLNRSKVRFLNLMRSPALEEMSAFRNVKRDLDIFFVVPFYNEAIHSANNSFRLKVMNEIRKIGNVSYLMGFTDMHRAEKDYAVFSLKRYGLRDYLMNLARARIAVYVRGLHDCQSFKLGQYLSMGKAIVGQRILNNEALFYANEGFAGQFAFEEPGMIAQKAAELLKKPDELKRLSEYNARIFDKNFTPAVIIGEMLETVLR